MVAAVLVSCTPLSEPSEVVATESRFLLGDPWHEVLKGRYVVGSSIPLRLTEWTRPAESRVILFAAPCRTHTDVCVEHTSYEVVSTNPTAVRVDRTGSSLVLRALAPGVAWLHASRDGVVVASEFVEVAQPERLELWAHGPGVLLLPFPLDESVTRFAGGVLEVQVRYYVGDRRFFSSSIVRWETPLSHETPTFSGNVIRIIDSEVGLERVRAVLGDLSVTAEVRSVDTVDELQILDLGDVDLEVDWPVWEPILVYATHSGAVLRGSLPLQWNIDGHEMGAIGWLECLLEPGVPSVVTVRLAEAEAAVVFAGTCVEVRLR